MSTAEIPDPSPHSSAELSFDPAPRLRSVRRGNEFFLTNPLRGELFRSRLLQLLRFGEGFCPTEDDIITTNVRLMSRLGCLGSGIKMGDMLAISGRGFIYMDDITATDVQSKEAGEVAIAVTNGLTLLGKLVGTCRGPYAFTKDPEEFVAMITDESLRQENEVDGHAVMMDSIALVDQAGCNQLLPRQNISYVSLDCLDLEFASVRPIA